MTAGAENQLTGLGFLDLYAGTGAMGLEAASRGASPVWLCESDQRTAQVIRRNITDTGLTVDLRTVSVASLLAGTPPQAFDVVWLDPPYALGLDVLEPLLSRIVEGGWVAGDGVLVVERSARDAAPVVAGCEYWTRPYGETVLHWFAPDARPVDEGTTS